MVFTEQTGLANLYSMVNYCIDKRACKRQLIAHHFDEHNGFDCERMCDTCRRVDDDKDGLEEVDCVAECRLVLEVLDKQDKSVTANKLCDLVMAEVKRKGQVWRVTAASDVEQLLLHMLMRELLKEDFHFTPYSTICYMVKGRRAGDCAVGSGGRPYRFNMMVGKGSQTVAKSVGKGGAAAVKSSKKSAQIEDEDDFFPERIKKRKKNDLVVEEDRDEDSIVLD
jgi:hypothetical protein